MAYVPPPIWIHFSAQIAESPTPPEYNVPSATLKNRYSGDLNEINTRMGAQAVNTAVGHISAGVGAPGGVGTAVLIHRMPWLHFRADASPGQLTDINGENAIVLSAPNNTYAVYDLDSIEWMAPGVLYRVGGVSMAAESNLP